MKMKKSITLLLTIALSINLFGCSSTSSTKNTKSTSAKTSEEAKSNWKVVNTIKLEQNSYFAGFYDSNFGMTVGYDGEVYYTNDGGKTWPKANNVSKCRFGLCIVNDKLAWTSGNGGNVRKSIDGGQNWQEAGDFGDDEPDQCRYTSFLDENVGWIAELDKLGATKDGGKTWIELKLPSGISDIMTIDLLKEDVGYLIDKKNNLYKTEDGGKTWNSKKLDIKNMTNAVWLSNTLYLRFYDANKATLFYHDNDKKVKCSKTTDGGNTWKEEVLPDIAEGEGLYLSADSKILTVHSYAKRQITILQEQ